jgi:IPTL-CTERM motif/WD40-like Beta Propeller Repeat
VNGTTRLASINAAGTQSGNGTSFATGISADGRRVVFFSSASDLVPLPDTNTSPDVFVRDFGIGSTLLVSVNSTGTGSGSFTSTAGTLTPDGRFVAFSSMANDLVPEDMNGRVDVFRRDLEAGVTRLVSGGNQGSGGDESVVSDRRVMSDDGRFVTFQSSDPTLVGGVTYPCNHTPCYQTFLRDLQTGALRLLSVSPSGDMAGDDDDFPAFGSLAQISRDGRVVVFQTSASNLATVPDTNDTSDIFVVGTPAEVVASAEIPTLSGSGLILLALLVAAGGALSLRRL